MAAKRKPLQICPGSGDCEMRTMCPHSGAHRRKRGCRLVCDINNTACCDVPPASAANRFTVTVTYHDLPRATVLSKFARLDRNIKGVTLGMQCIGDHYGHAVHGRNLSIERTV